MEFPRVPKGIPFGTLLPFFLYRHLSAYQLQGNPFQDGNKNIVFSMAYTFNKIELQSTHHLGGYFYLLYI